MSGPTIIVVALATLNGLALVVALALSRATRSRPLEPVAVAGAPAELADTRYEARARHAGEERLARDVARRRGATPAATRRGGATSAFRNRELGPRARGTEIETNLGRPLFDAPAGGTR